MKTCIIIDDENKARSLLQNMLAETTDQLTVVASCDDLPSGIKAIHKYKPDLIFLDIEMPWHSGLEILNYFDDDQITFEIIFTTGYSEYAIQAFKLSAIDYILKPINPEILADAVNCFLKKENASKVIDYRALQENLLPQTDYAEKCLTVNLSNSTRFIKVNDITMLQAEGSYCTLYLSSGEKLLASKNLKHFEERLEGIPFLFRSHKSFIVNLKKVLEYNRSENNLSLQGNLNSMLSTEKSTIFLEKMSQL